MVAHRARPSAPARAGWLALVTLARAVGPCRYGVADVVGLAAYALQPRRRRRTVANHERADPTCTVREARRRARASFRQFVRTSVDFAWANHMPTEMVLRESVVRGAEHVRAAQGGGRGAVLAMAHFGNWDMAATLAVAHGVPLTTVMAPLGPASVTDLITWVRERNDLEVFGSVNAARGLVRALRRGRFVALLCDVTRDGRTVAVPYRGGLVPFSIVPAWLTLHTGAPLLPAQCWREDGRYVLEIHPPIDVAPGDDERSIMSRVAGALEPMAKRRPEQWYPFGRVYED